VLAQPIDVAAKTTEKKEKLLDRGGLVLIFASLRRDWAVIGLEMEG
jgi:hypothetical protein